MKLRSPLSRRWWVRPTVYTLVAAILSSGGYAVQQVQGKTLATQATASANQVLLTHYTTVARLYHTFLDDIATAKAAGIDTTNHETDRTLALSLLNSGKFDQATSVITSSTSSLTAAIAADAAAKAQAEEDAKKYGTLTVTTQAGANVVIDQGGQTQTATADGQGNAQFKALTGTYTVTVTANGFETLTIPNVVVTSLGSTPVTATLKPVPAPTATPTATPKPKPTPTPTATPSQSSSTANSSYERTTVSSDRGSFTADIMRFDLGAGKIKVITDTASDTDCATDCPVMAVKSYADRYNGAIAAINGTYFCPTDYSACHPDQVNNFFWKIKNPRTGTMINGTDGLGENDGFLTFNSSGSATYYSRWIDAPNVYAGINHKPTLVTNGAYSVDESTLDDKQRTSKITRGAIGLKGQELTVVIIQSATIMDLGSVMTSLGMDVALNLDGGGSSAMWYNGSYKRGPGRGVPNALVFIQQ